MLVHSPLKKAPRAKRRREDAGDAFQKKHKARGTNQPASNSTSESVQPRRSGRAGAGVGGHILQMERIGAAIEGSQAVETRPTTTFSNDTALNPVAPANSSRRPRKKVRFHLFNSA